ncbi:DUF928 domain-containing protein [Dapis sp. BLCC M172]|uniref:DUF928 domain-containing protein n=1 Tax=Dapis sp. BLCC M172 TaxID=2975281 RepID=UPI003CEF41D7
MKLNFHLTILGTVALLTPICLTSVVNAEIEILQREVIAQNIRFQTPEIREQGNRTRTFSIIKEGTRSRCEFKDAPTALIPETNIGLTLAEYPKFFVYFPTEDGECGYSYQPAEFELFDEAGKTVYITELKLPDARSIIRINLPDDGSITPLAVGKKYQWRVLGVLDIWDRSSDLEISSGWIKRIEITPTLLQQLQTTTPDNHPQVYAQAGIWHETLDSLVTLRQSDPNNSTFLIQWPEILKSVGLETVADAPLLTDSNQPTETKQNQDSSDLR